MKKSLLSWIYIIPILLCSQLTFGQYRNKSFDWNMDAYEKYTFSNSLGSTPYRLLPPPQKDPAKKYPLVIMLHGKGEGLGQQCSIENGPNVCNILWGGKMHLDSINKYPSYVVFPQTGGGDWQNEKPLGLLKGLLENLIRTYNIDLDRVYIHGLSAGGTGVWNMSYLYPHLFAAISPHSAPGDHNQAAKLKYTPIWTVQGELDGNPTPNTSLGMMDALRNQGKKVDFTLDQITYKQNWSHPVTPQSDPIYTLALNESHVAWPVLYNSGGWLKWLYSQNKNRLVVIGRTTLSAGETVKLGVSPGFDAYQWSNGATTNEITVSQPGTYRVRYLRKQYFFSGPAIWSNWSEPITITTNSTQGPVADAGKDILLKSPASSTKVRGYGAGNNIVYKWTKVSGGTATMSNIQTNTLVLTNLQMGSYTFRLTVTDQTGKVTYDDAIVKVADPNMTPSVTGFTLVDAVSKSDIRAIKNGDVINLSTLPKNINIRVDTDPYTTGSVKITYDGVNKTENSSPYEWYGEAGGKLTAGKHTLSGAPYKGSNLSGTQGNGMSISFTVVTSATARMSADTTQSAAMANDAAVQNDSTDSDNVVLYPNPFSEEVLNILFAAKQSNVKVYVYDESGNMIHQTRVDMFGDILVSQIYLPELRPGIYRIRITSDKISNKMLTVIKK
ncbi:MAG: T9SS type A sorting domain-containing protein [Cytophagaceae bacterium]|nr:T9SS type A sorting domain-containing protein [Cytophagaceae bacterium]